MTSDTWSNLLYPKQAPLLWCVSLLTAVSLLSFLHLSQNRSAQQDATGQMLADNLAALSAPAFLRHDRIQLGLFSNRVSALTNVHGVIITTADATPLANTVEPGAVATKYSSAVRVDDSVLGYVEVYLLTDSAAAVPGWRHWVFGMTLALIIPMLLQLLHTVFTQRRQQLAAQPTVAIATGPSADRIYTVTANLFDQMRLTNATQQEAQDQAMAWAEDIAMLYNGYVHAHSQGTISIHFEDHGQEDRCFAALCAGYLWSDCLRASDLPGSYRLSGHVIGGVFGDGGAFGDGVDIGAEHNNVALALQDSLLLAAAAQDGELVISDRLHAQLQRPERVQLTTLQHPLHEDLHTAGASLHRVLGLASRYAVLLARQLERLHRQPQATESLSTF